MSSLITRVWFLVVPTVAYVHPGIIVSRDMLEHIRANVRAKQEPTSTAFSSALSYHPPGGYNNVSLANLSYQPHPVQLEVVNTSLSPGTRWVTCKEDSLAAYTHALLWFVTEDEAHALKAVEIMDAWSRTLTHALWLADSLEAAWAGTIWARAAEIIRHTSSAWTDHGIAAFELMLQGIFLPMVNQGASTNGNIALVMSEAALHIGLFADNTTAVDAAFALWRKQAPAYLYVSSDGPTPHRPPAQRFLARTAPTCGPNCTDAQIFTFWHGNSDFAPHSGIAQETCRDLGHVQMLVSAFVNFAETAWHQGIDLYTEHEDRIIATAEFHSTLFSNTPVPYQQKWPSWLCGGNCTGIHCTSQPGETFEMVYHHFVTRRGLSLPNVTALLPQLRPTSCWDQLCWETLTHGDPLD